MKDNQPGAQSLGWRRARSWLRRPTRRTAILATALVTTAGLDFWAAMAALDSIAGNVPPGTPVSHVSPLAAFGWSLVMDLIAVCVAFPAAFALRGARTIALRSVVVCMFLFCVLVAVVVILFGGGAPIAVFLFIIVIIPDLTSAILFALGRFSLAAFLLAMVIVPVLVLFVIQLALLALVAI
jgi:hypothetical protein